MKMNFLDRAISYVAPVAGEQRAAARARLQGAENARMIYEGAARSHRTSFRRGGGTSANTEIALSLPRLRDVSRDFGRNNPVASNIHSAIPANVVGAGIVPAVTAANKKRKLAVQKLVTEHLDTPAIDFDGRNNLYAIQNLVMRTVVESGDALVVRYLPPARLRLPVPLQVRVLEADYLDAFKNGPTSDGGVCFQGIQFDKDGRRTGYWLYDEHPGGGITWRLPKSQFVAAADVIHIYRMDRAGQYRGIPWGAAGVMTMWDLGDYEEAELMRQKIAACFAVFWTGTEAGGLAESVTGQKTQAGSPVEVLEPGLIQRLPPNSDVKFATPPMMQGYRDFIAVNSRKVCTAYGVPYEIGTGDMSQVSFISGRLGMLQFNRNVDQWRWHMLIPHLCCGIGNWFLQAAMIPLGGPSGATLSWTPPRREMVSPKDEIPPIRDAIRAGLSSLSEELRKQGYDPEDVAQEIADDNARNDKLGLRFDSDGRVPLATHGTEAIPPVDDDGETPPVKPDDQPNEDNGNG